MLKLALEVNILRDEVPVETCCLSSTSFSFLDAFVTLFARGHSERNEETHTISFMRVK